MERIPRIAMLAAAVIAAVAATFVSRAPLRPARELASHHSMAATDMTPLFEDIPNEASGRVERWEHKRLLAAEAEAAAQAKARVDQRPISVPSYPPGSIQDIITRAFAPLGPTAVAWGLRVARCESGYNPRAYNPAGPYYGLFQFLMSTFRATPYGNQDIYDPMANASAAAWKYSRGGAGAWGCR